MTFGPLYPSNNHFKVPCQSLPNRGFTKGFLLKVFLLTQPVIFHSSPSSPHSIAKGRVSAPPAPAANRARRDRPLLAAQRRMPAPWTRQDLAVLSVGPSRRLRRFQNIAPLRFGRLARNMPIPSMSSPRLSQVSKKPRGEISRSPTRISLVVKRCSFKHGRLSYPTHLFWGVSPRFQLARMRCGDWCVFCSNFWAFSRFPPLAQEHSSLLHPKECSKPFNTSKSLHLNHPHN